MADELNIIYPKIRELEKCPEIFCVKDVVITEKIHGKNMRIIIPPRVTDSSQIIMGGREITEKESKYGLGSETIYLRENLPLARIVDRFKEENVPYVIYGEILGPGVQKKMQYSKQKEFRVFDISMGEYLLDFSEMSKICDEVGLKIVPVLFKGSPSLDVFNKLVNVESQLAKENGFAGTITEGIVVKSSPSFKNTFGDYVICKYKSRGFEEKISTKEEKPKVDVSLLADFAAKYVVENRVRKMIDKLREKGNYSGSMGDAKAIGDELAKDIESEEKKELAEMFAKNETLNSKMLFAEIMKVAMPLFKKILEEDS